MSAFLCVDKHSAHSICLYKGHLGCSRAGLASPFFFFFFFFIEPYYGLVLLKLV